jgi:hypothetical protein
VFNEIEKKVEDTTALLGELGYDAEEVTTTEIHDYMTGETFSGDKTTIGDILDSEYLMVHEIVEISELKKRGILINKRTLMDSPKTVIYDAHFSAMEFEMGYASRKGDLEWLRIRLGHHREVLDDDPFLPESMKPRALALYDRFKEYE